MSSECNAHSLKVDPWYLAAFFLGNTVMLEINILCCTGSLSKLCILKFEKLACSKNDLKSLFEVPK